MSTPKKRRLILDSVEVVRGDTPRTKRLLHNNFSSRESFYHDLPEEIFEGSRVLKTVWPAEQIDIVRRRLLDQITGQSDCLDLLNLKDEEESLCRILRQTINDGVGGSALVLGPKASGKSLLINRVLKRFYKTADVGDEEENPFLDPKASNTEQPFIEVRLNALLQGDDRTTLQEFAKQLLQNTTSREDILSMTEKVSTADSFAEILKFISSRLRRQPIVVLLENFDLFARRNRQSFLYGLLDATQSSDTSLLVIGVTSRVGRIIYQDVLQLLEKRVKSRFSHRVILLHPMARFDDFKELIRHSLLLKLTCDSKDAILPGLREEFNLQVNNLMENPDMLAVVRRVFDFTRNVRQVFNLLLPAILELNPEKPFINANTVMKCCINNKEDYRLKIIHELGILELCLLICIKRLMEKGESKFNFAQIYREYKSLNDYKHTGFKLHPTTIAIKSYENLIQLGLIMLTDRGFSKPLTFRLARSMLSVEEIYTAIANYTACPEAIKQWNQKLV